MIIFANQVTPEVPGRQEFGKHYSSQGTHALWQCQYPVGSATENPGGKGRVAYNKREHYEENKEETRVLFLLPFSLLLLPLFHFLLLFLLLLHLFSPGQLLLGCGLSAPNREWGTAFHGPPLYLLAQSWVHLWGQWKGLYVQSEAWVEETKCVKYKTSTKNWKYNNITCINEAF